MAQRENNIFAVHTGNCKTQGRVAATNCNKPYENYMRNGIILQVSKSACEISGFMHNLVHFNSGEVSGKRRVAGSMWIHKGADSHNVHFNFKIF